MLGQKKIDYIFITITTNINFFWYGLCTKMETNFFLDDCDDVSMAIIEYSLHYRNINRERYFEFLCFRQRHESFRYGLVIGITI